VQPPQGADVFISEVRKVFREARTDTGK